MTPVLSFALPTHNRPAELARTLSAIGELRPSDFGRSAEVLIADNGSDPPVQAPPSLANGIDVFVHRLEHNAGAAARNELALAARGDWIVMLDDDSAPRPGPIAAVLAATPGDVAAVGGEIVLPGGRREAGGLPEVVVGCGAAVRRDVFLAAGGYDPSFDYYAEEYDLCARLIAAGRRVVHTRSIAFEHRKVTAGRDFGRIVGRLVRNNAWVIRRYAPDDVVDAAVDAVLARYRGIAEHENAMRGYLGGVAELRLTLDRQIRTPLDHAGWARFTGAAAARTHLAGVLQDAAAVRLTRPGKGREVVERTLGELGIAIDPAAETAVIATLSPGPMLDAAEAEPGAIRPWLLADPASARRPAPADAWAA